MFYRIVLNPETGYHLTGKYYEREAVDTLLGLLRTPEGCAKLGLHAGEAAGGYINASAVEVYQDHDYPRVVADMRGQGI